MNSFLARGIGHARPPLPTTRSLWKSSRRKTAVAKQQHRSYSDDGVRWTAGGVTFSGEEEGQIKKREHNPAISSTATKKPRWGVRTAFPDYETSTGDPFFTQRSPEEEQEQHPEKQKSEHDNLFEQQFETDVSEEPELPRKRQRKMTAKQQNGLWNRFERAEDEESNAAQAEESDASSENDLSNLHQGSLLNVDYKSELPVALSRGDADMVTRCLFAAERDNDVDFLASIPQSTFSDIIRVLDSSNFVAKLASTHVELSASLANSFGLAPMYQVAYDYGIVLRRVVRLRRSAGAKLTLEDYTMLLRNARDLGSRKMSVVMWTTMLEDGHKPTTTCYNHLMSATIWNGAHLAGSRQSVRIIPFNMMARQQQRKRFKNYAVGPEGLKENVLRSFNEMIGNGATADEGSFRILVTACAREGDIETAKTVLNKVWGIDVDGIMEGREVIPKRIPEKSTLQPTAGLLWTIAHAFGINNDVPAALRVVDFVARSFQIPVTDETWSQLFEWTFVLSINRNGTSLRDGSTVGALPQSSVMSLWETMIGSPYFVQPSMGMYNKLMKSLWRRGWAPEIAVRMREGLSLYEQHRIEAILAESRFASGLRRTESSPASESVEHLRNEFEYREIIRRRDVFWLRRWCQLYLSSFRDWHKVDYSHDGLTRELPTILWEFRHWLLYTVQYETATGFIEFEPWSEEEREEIRRQAQTRAENRQKSLDAAKKFVGHTWVFGREREFFEPRKVVRSRKRNAARNGSRDVDVRGRRLAVQS